jgi:hypothetical protein
MLGGGLEIVQASPDMLVFRFEDSSAISGYAPSRVLRTVPNREEGQA